MAGAPMVPPVVPLVPAPAVVPEVEAEKESEPKEKKGKGDKDVEEMEEDNSAPVVNDTPKKTKTKKRKKAKKQWTEHTAPDGRTYYFNAEKDYEEERIHEKNRVKRQHWKYREAFCTLLDE